MPRILIVTGEASGDLHGANLAGAIRSLRPDAQLFGVGGPKMLAAGVDLMHGIDRLDIVGLVGLTQLPAVLRTYRALGRLLRQNRFDVVVFIDNPGLNLRLIRIARRAGHRIVYYIGPQLWAWNPGRMRMITGAVDRMLVILPFEVELYRQAGVPCEFVGHPLLDAMVPTYDRDELRKRFGCEPAGQVLGLLPGSRQHEVRSLLPEMLEAGARLMQEFPGLQVLIAQASSIPDEVIREIVDASGNGARVIPRIIRDQPNEVMAASDVLLVASGTATLQAAIIGTPMVIAYKVSWLTYWVGRMVVRVKWIGLANIVAQRQIIPELIQRDATAERLALEAGRLLRDEAAANAMRRALAGVRQSLGEPDASRRAATAVLRECAA
jgi:lipid-A-disaccharide synthase